MALVLCRRRSTVVFLRDRRTSEIVIKVRGISKVLIVHWNKSTDLIEAILRQLFRLHARPSLP